MDQQHNGILVNINYQEKNISHVRDGALFNINDFFDIHQVVSPQQLQSFIETSFEERIQAEKKKIVEQVRKEQQKRIDAEIASQKLKLSADYMKKVSHIANQVKKILMTEFSMTDPYALESLVNRCLHTLDEEKPEFIFISKENFEIIKEKLENEKISIAGHKIPIAIGHGLNNDQVMIEGQSSVVVSDLGALIDNYFSAEDFDTDS